MAKCSCGAEIRCSCGCGDIVSVKDSDTVIAGTNIVLRSNYTTVCTNCGDYVDTTCVSCRVERAKAYKRQQAHYNFTGKMFTPLGILIIGWAHVKVGMWKRGLAFFIGALFTVLTVMVLSEVILSLGVAFAIIAAVLVWIFYLLDVKKLYDRSKP